MLLIARITFGRIADTFARERVSKTGEGFALGIIHSMLFAIVGAAPVLVVHRAFFRGARQADARCLGGARSVPPETQLICERLAICIGTRQLRQCPRCSHFVRREVPGETDA